MIIKENRFVLCKIEYSLIYNFYILTIFDAAIGINSAKNVHVCKISKFFRTNLDFKYLNLTPVFFITNNNCEHTHILNYFCTEKLISNVYI